MIIAGALVAHPGAAIAGAPIGKIGLRIVGRGHPDRSASGLPLIASRPGLAAGLPRLRHHESAPQLLAGLRVIRGHETAHAQFAAGGAEHHLAVGNERHDRRVISLSVIGDLRGPRFLAGLDIERHQDRISRREEYLVAEKSNPAIGRVQIDPSLREAAVCSAIGDRRSSRSMPAAGCRASPRTSRRC